MSTWAQTMAASIETAAELERIQPADRRMVLGCIAQKADVSDDAIAAILAFALAHAYGDRATIEAREWKLTFLRSGRPS